MINTVWNTPISSILFSLFFVFLSSVTKCTDTDSATKEFLLVFHAQNAAKFKNSMYTWEEHRLSLVSPLVVIAMLTTLSLSLLKVRKII